MAADGDAIITFIFNGEDIADIPRDVTHLIIHESITVIPAWLFKFHPNLVEVYCHAGVTKIEKQAFYFCRSLRRAIIPGVIIIEKCAFYSCTNLVHVECGKLERIEASAFLECIGLSIINLPSAKIVERGAFSVYGGSAMTQVIFGKDLESIDGWAFVNCSSLKSITIPLRSGLFTEDNIFIGCVNLKRVDLIEGEALRNFADALLFERWKNDMNEVLDSINKSLPDTAAGEYDDDGVDSNGRKAIAIRQWVESVLRKVTHYKAAHRKLLDEAATVLQLYLPNDAVINNILPFVELPALEISGEDGAELHHIHINTLTIVDKFRFQCCNTE